MDKKEISRKWIVHLLESIAKQQGVTILECSWELDNTYAEPLHQLVVVGTGQKRALKLFAANEIERCLEDHMLQSSIQSQLTRLVNFLGGRLDSPKQRKTKSTQ